jgi:hypothetical protein
VGTGTYYAVTTSADGCESGTAQVSVTIHTVPEAPAVWGGGTQCGGTLPIYASPGNGGNGIRWLDSGTESSRNVGTGTYEAVSTTSEGCKSSAAQVSVTIHTVPEAPAVWGGGTQCGGTLPLYASAGNNGTGIRWEDNGSTELSRHVGSGMYRALTTSAAGCESGWSEVVVVTINPVPDAPAVSGGGTQCGGTMNITASAGNNGTGIRWEDNGSAETSRNVGTGTYRALTTSAAGCESGWAAGVVVTVIDIPAMPTLNSPSPACVGNYLTFTASGGSGYYDWAGNVSGTGNSKQAGTTVGNYTARVRSYLTSSDVTCYSSYTSDVTGVIQAPAHLGEYTNACGCESGTERCDNGVCLQTGCRPAYNTYCNIVWSAWELVLGVNNPNCDEVCAETARSWGYTGYYCTSSGESWCDCKLCYY